MRFLRTELPRSTMERFTGVLQNQTSSVQETKPSVLPQSPLSVIYPLKISEIIHNISDSHLLLS